MRIKEMIMVEESASMFMVERLENGNFNIKGYSNYNGEQKIWWNTERKANGDSVRKKGTMETRTTYNDLKELAINILLKYKDIKK